MLATATRMQLGGQLHADNRMKRILGGEQQSAPFARPQIDEGVFFEVQLEPMKDLPKYGRGYPKVPGVEQVFSLPLGRSSANISPLVSTPNCRSKGCTGAYSFGRSMVLEGGRKPFRNNIRAVAIVPRCARDFRSRCRIRRRFNLPLPPSIESPGDWLPQPCRNWSREGISSSKR
jgi:hypothetical protein